MAPTKPCQKPACNVWCVYSWIDDRKSNLGSQDNCLQSDRSAADGGTGLVTKPWCHRRTNVFTDNKPHEHWHCEASKDKKGLDANGNECDAQKFSDANLLSGV